jgi:putative PIN family toxin of toxin-antitoxin system
MRAAPNQVRAVFDCMIFLQGAARREGPAGVCLLMVELGAVELFISREIVAEVREVLSRPRIREKFLSLTDDLVNHFLEAMTDRATMIQDVATAFTYERDPKDEPYINLAITAEAEYLVTRDRDLLDLFDGANLDGEKLRDIAPHLQIVEPARFLLELEEWSNKKPRQ